jgi:hypothetical protein
MARNTRWQALEYSAALAMIMFSYAIISRGFTMRSFRFWLMLVVLVVPVIGCGTSGDDVPRTKEGLVPLPERPGPSKEEQKAEYLKRSKAQGRPRG